LTERLACMVKRTSAKEISSLRPQWETYEPMKGSHYQRQSSVKLVTNLWFP